MSRTDIHRPAWVQAQDPLTKNNWKAFHHHPTRDSAGRPTCDLDRFLAAFYAGDWARTRCYVQWWGGPNICGCSMCTGQPSRRLARRRDRLAARRACQIAAGEYAAGQLDEDGPWIPRAEAY